MPVSPQRAQHEKHRQHKAQRDRQRAHQPGRQRLPPAQLGWQGVCGTGVPAPGGRKTQTLLGATLYLEQERHHHQQHGGQLRGGHAVVHAEPGLVNAGREGLNAEVARNSKVGQCFHQRQCHARSHRRPGQRQGHFADAARQGRAQQAGRLHEMHRPLAQRRARQQINIRVKRDSEHQHRTAQAAHLGQQPALPAEGLAQAHLERPAVLQKIGVSVGHHISGHGQRQKQRPFKSPPAGKVEQSHHHGRAHAQGGHARGHAQTQHQRGGGVLGQHRMSHFPQQQPGRPVQLRPRQRDRQHWQGQRQHQAKKQRRG